MVVGREKSPIPSDQHGRANFQRRAVKTLVCVWSVLGTQITLRETRYPEVDIKSGAQVREKENIYPWAGI